MTASIPQQLQGTQAPSTLEVLWEKNRRTIKLVGVAILVALGLNYAVRAYAKAKTNKAWSAFATTTRLDVGYDNQELIKSQMVVMAERELPGVLARELPKVEKAKLDKAIAEASAEERPFLLWAAASQAVLTREFDRADALLTQLKSAYPHNSFCEATKYPVQFRLPKDKARQKPDSQKKPELEPAVESSMVDLLRRQIDYVKGFEEPGNFKQQPIPEDAPKYLVKTSMGEFTIALLEKEAPKHVEEFKKLVTADGSHWNGMRVDQIERTGTRAQSSMRKATQFHFGLEGSKKDDRTQWTDKEPSKHQVEYEHNSRSHFPGAVSARQEGTKSSVDRLWVSVDDNLTLDGNRVIFGYVVDGMDVLRKIGEAGLATQGEEEAGSGKPQDDIKIESVIKL
jgi:cyclophilin family peptidyl-prolyl cis-trans isomerase